jgi:hypothetical protein
MKIPVVETNVIIDTDKLSDIDSMAAEKAQELYEFYEKNGIATVILHANYPNSISHYNPTSEVNKGKYLFEMLKFMVDYMSAGTYTVIPTNIEEDTRNDEGEEWKLGE